MRLDLPVPLKKGEKYFKIKYWYNINDRMKLGEGPDMSTLLKMITIYIQ